MRKVLSLVIVVSVMVSMLALTPVAGAATTGWTKIANAEFPNPPNGMLMFPSVEFQDKLYFWVPFSNDPSPSPAPVWAYDGTNWSQSAADGFGDINNLSTTGGVVFDNHLYMGTANMSGTGQIWRTADGTTWNRVRPLELDGITPVFPEDGNHPVGMLLGVQDDKLLIEFYGYDNAGAKVWAYDGSDPSLAAGFTRANNDGFSLNVGTSKVCQDTSLGTAVFNGRIQVCAKLYEVSTGNITAVVPLEYRGGTTWVQTALNNFGDANNQDVIGMATVGDAAYAGTQNHGGGQIWKLDDSGWNRVPTDSIVQNDVLFPAALGDRLEVSTIMESTEGTPVGPARVFLQNPDDSFSLWIDQFDDPTNMIILASEFNGQCVAGVGNPTGFQMWTTPIPSITSLSTQYTYPGTTITITGTGFGADPGSHHTASYVRFGTFTPAESDYVSWSDTSIQVKVPIDAYYQTDVKVHTDTGGDSNSIVFYVQAYISTCSPTWGNAGFTSITLTGYGFGPTRGTNSVWFDGSKATTYTSWTNNQIKVTVGAGAQGQSHVKVMVMGCYSNAKAFDVRSIITAMSPTSGPTGTVVTIAGSAYCNSQGSGCVFFGSKQVTSVVSWKQTQIKVKVPSGISGTVSVKVYTSGGMSNGKNFTKI